MENGITMRIFNQLFFKIYSLCKSLEKEILDQNRLKQHNENAIIGLNTIIEPEAHILNYLYKQERIKIGKNCHILGSLMLFSHGGKIAIGDHCYIGSNTKIWSAESISIGDRVLISHNVNIHDNISHPLDSTLRHQDFVHIRKSGFQKKNDLREKSIMIEDDVWIGFNSTIHKGVKIGKGAIIGSDTVITKDVPSYAVMVGNPAKIVKQTT
jgi:acetyltransferase-like isoleucine patch superfamily enzyme